MNSVTNIKDQEPEVCPNVYISQEQSKTSYHILSVSG